MERCETVQKFRQFRERFYVRSRVSQSFLQVLSTKCSLAYSRKIAYKTSYVTTSSTCRANKGFLNKEKVAHFFKSISITMKFFYCQETAKCAIRGLAKTNRLRRGQVEHYLLRSHLTFETLHLATFRYRWGILHCPK